MSAIATSQLNRAVRFYEAAVGKKVVMAVTGVILFGYVVAHLLGNLQIFEGPDAINSYAAFLQSHEGALWVARASCCCPWCCTSWPPCSSGCRTASARPVAYVQEGRRADLLRRPHHDVERPHHRRVRDLPRAAPDRRRGVLPLRRPSAGRTARTSTHNVITGFQNPAGLGASTSSR